MCAHSLLDLFLRIPMHYILYNTSNLLYYYQPRSVINYLTIALIIICKTAFSAKIIHVQSTNQIVVFLALAFRIFGRYWFLFLSHTQFKVV